MAVRGSRILGRLGLLAASLVFVALLGELLLQTGALVVRASGRHPDEAFSTAHRRIVCLGDSNTYGLFLERDQAYPQQLEDHWNESGGSPTIEVLNLGYPGTNSSTVLRELPGILRKLSPDGVIALVGANDFWTSPVGEAEPLGRLDRIGGWLRDHSRLVRIYAMLRDRGAGHEVRAPPVTPDPTISRRVGTLRYGDHAFELGFEGRKEWAPSDMTQLIANLESLAVQAEAAGTSLILLTYPSNDDLYGAANERIREAATSTGTPLVDLTAVFTEACPDADCTRLFFADRHPTALGYELMAKAIAQWVPSLLEPAPR
jgi:lysophospholipase L1-like esterase